MVADLAVSDLARCRTRVLDDVASGDAQQAQLVADGFLKYRTVGGRPGFGFLSRVHGGQQAHHFGVETVLGLGQRLELPVHLVAQPAQGRAVVVQ